MKTLSSNFGLSIETCRRIFSFFKKQSLKGIDNQKELIAIIAGIITFAPDRRYNYSQYTTTVITSAGETDCIDYCKKMSNFQDECFQLLDVYLERYNNFDKTLIREV